MLPLSGLYPGACGPEPTGIEFGCNVRPLITNTDAVPPSTA